MSHYQSRIQRGLCPLCCKPKIVDGYYRCALCRERDREAHKSKSYRSARKQRRQRNREICISHYGGACACCGIKIFRFLTIDHENNDGARHRREVVRDNTISPWLIRNKFPLGFRVLCFSCNFSYGMFGICSHDVQSYIQINPVRVEVLKAYGGECACCSEKAMNLLTIDHMNGNGAAHKRSVGGSTASLYRWLRRNRFPDGFRVLCMNCNAGRYHNGNICPHEENRVEAA